LDKHNEKQITKLTDVINNGHALLVDYVNGEITYNDAMQILKVVDTEVLEPLRSRYGRRRSSRTRAGFATGRAASARSAQS